MIRSALVMLGVLGAAAPARAGETPTSYAVIAFDVSGNTDSTLRKTVQGGLSRGAAEAGADVISYENTQSMLADKPALAGCVSESCLAGIAEVVGTDHFLQVTITANGANYELVVELVVPGMTTRRRSGACTVCTVADLADLAATRVTDLLTSDGSTPQTVSIASDPTGATLDIAGLGEQQAPWSGELAPGTIAIAARLPGYHDAHQEITVVDDGTEQHFDIRLDALPPPPGPYHTIKWITAGGAATALLLGTVLLVMDGNPTCDASGVTCPEEYDTGLAGGVIGAVGLAGAGAAGYMFFTEF